MERLGISEEDARAYLRQLQNAIREKLEFSPMRWPISRQKSLRKHGLRICFGKNLSPYLAIFKVYPQSRKVLVYRIVWQHSNYASFFIMD
jgi:hypothetical protein